MSLNQHQYYVHEITIVHGRNIEPMGEKREPAVLLDNDQEKCNVQTSSGVLPYLLHLIDSHQQLILVGDGEEGGGREEEERGCFWCTTCYAVGLQ